MLEHARKILKNYYGYNEFRPGQAKVIDSLLSGKDVLAIMPTGAGKSLCYQIPALELEGVTLVVSPLISLMKDQVDALNGQGISATFINSSLSAAQVNERLYQVRLGRYKLVYVAPERLDTEQFQTAIRQLTIAFVAIDEAHCVSQWGHDFRPSYRGINTFIKRLAKRPLIGAFTATATPEVKSDIIKLLNLQQPDVHVSGFDRANLSFTILKGEDKETFVVNYIKDNPNEAGVIYAATRKTVDKLYMMLQAKGVSVGCYHAGMSNEERNLQQEKFIYDEIQVMVATNAFGMGIDKSNVRFVLHYNMPKNIESYYQEAGRAGRDGEPGECILLFEAQDILLQKFLIEQSVESPERKLYEHKRLQMMIDYCHTPECLRQYILQYFGENGVSGECGNCGNCNSDAELLDITEDAQKVLSCVARIKERFGVSMVADVLKGSRNKKVTGLGFDQLSTYGLLSRWSADEIRNFINRLIATGYLLITEGEYPVVKLAPAAFPVLKNQEQVWQKMLKRQVRKKDDTLFERLRLLRKEIAEREKVPPYVVFADSTLKEMSSVYPGDFVALSQIKGVGKVKLASYGEEFLAVIGKYAVEHQVPLTKSPTLQHEVPAVMTEVPSHEQTLTMYQQGTSLSEIAKVRNLTLITVQNHLVRCSREGLPVNWDPLIPTGYEQMILTKIKEIGMERLKPIKEALPEEIEYIAIQAVICKYIQQLELGAS